jgi:predicted acyltransferase
MTAVGDTAPALPTISSPSSAPSIAGGPARIEAVDALRGFDMLCTIALVNTGLAVSDMLTGHGPLLEAIGRLVGAEVDHPNWVGLTFYDLMFPLFIFIAGVVIPVALTRLVAREGRRAAHWRVLSRSALLFLIGFLYYGGLSHRWPDVRLMGVLQRIALCYLFASLLFLNLRLRGLIVSFVVLLVGYWALLTFVPVPGAAADRYGEAANLARWLDEHFLPGKKLMGAYDPEGLLSTLPAIGTALLGVFAGLLLQNARLSQQMRVLWLAGGGVALLAVGGLWSFQFPPIKWIWTSTYVLLTGGISALLLAAFYQVIDICGYRRWTVPFVWVGANAILLYILNEVARFHRLAARFVGGDIAAFADAHLTHGAGQFLANLLGVLLAVALAGFLYQRRLFLRV